MKKAKYWIGVALFLFLGTAFCVATGGKRSDVYLNDFIVADEMETITLDVGVASSAGFIRTLTANQETDSLYVTFYSTYGINNSIGAKTLFPINIESNCDKIYFYHNREEKWKLVLQKDVISGKWERVK